MNSQNDRQADRQTGKQLSTASAGASPVCIPVDGFLPLLPLQITANFSFFLFLRSFAALKGTRNK